ncbi:IS1634 family transposase [Heliobacillus mobilis]|uniref:IS1634 family transposase n=2 Tax=Heliobacterium mobile TaxID=28064 RepID=A0A6I3SPF7_HELMO|nr:IS1634 family transposase [Heliobacterium mobile]
MDGNLSDRTWNRETIEELAQLLVPHIGRGLLYVADSALVSSKNLEVLAKEQIPFISRLPSTYKLASELKEEAQSREQWTMVGKLSDKADAAVYQIQERTGQLYDRTYRFIVVHSSSLTQQKKNTIDRKVIKEKAALEKDCTSLRKKTFACQSDAEQELQSFLNARESCFHELSGTVFSVQREKPRQGKGRRPVSYVPQYETLWQVDCAIGALNTKKIDAALRMEEVFILMTNEMDTEKLPAMDILRKYKEQHTVEARFRWLKDPTVVDQIWLKNPNRVMALGYIFLIGLLVYCLLERRIRKSLAKETKPIRLHGNRLTKAPTAAAFLQLFSDIVVMNSVLPNQAIQRALPKRFQTDELKRALKIAGFDLDIYTTVPLE